MNEKELIEIQIANLQGQIKEKQKKLEELSQTKSPEEEAYKRWRGEYPPSDNFDYWPAFRMGYHYSLEDSAIEAYIKRLEVKQEENEWKSIALRFGENLSDIGPDGYYKFAPEEWYDWAVNTYEKLCDDTVKLLNKEKLKKAQERGERVHNEMEEVVRESVKWCEENKDKDPLEWLTTPKSFMYNCIITGNPPNGYSHWSDWYNELGSKGILANLRISSNECEPTPKTPEETAESLKEAFVKAQQTEKWKEMQKKIDEKDNDKNFKNSLDLIKEWGEKNKPPTLYQLIEDWWCDVFCSNSTDDMETCIDGLVDKIDKKFIPPSSEKNGYEWEKCLKIMRDKLR